MKKLDLKSKRFGRLTVLYEDSERKSQSRVRWVCECDCGKVKSILSTNLIGGNTQSCGCLKSEVFRSHGLYHHPLYKIWSGMKGRCNNLNSTGYARYGGRGITVCDRWLDSFENFYEDMKEGYSKELQIDRIDNDGNYEPSNCRWVTRSQNSINTRPKGNSTSKYKGVSWNKLNNNWRANIKGKNLGSFICEHEAAREYNKAASLLYKNYAYLNKIED